MKLLPRLFSSHCRPLKSRKGVVAEVIVAGEVLPKPLVILGGTAEDVARVMRALPERTQKILEQKGQTK